MLLTTELQFLTERFVTILSFCMCETHRISYKFVYSKEYVLFSHASKPAKINATWLLVIYFIRMVHTRERIPTNDYPVVFTQGYLPQGRGEHYDSIGLLFHSIAGTCPMTSTHKKTINLNYLEAPRLILLSCKVSGTPLYGHQSDTQKCSYYLGVRIKRWLCLIVTFVQTEETHSMSQISRTRNKTCTVVKHATSLCFRITNTNAF